MTLDFHIGRMTTVDVNDDPDALPRIKPDVAWDGPLPEDDGTDRDCTCFPGEPHRMVGWPNVYDMFEKLPVLHELLDGWTGTNDWQLFPITEAGALAVENSPDPGDRVNHDRWLWLRYWVRRAREEYSDEAGILLT